MSTDIQSIVFDYGDLPAEKVMECEAAHQAACSIENQAVILIGEQFAKVKENLKYLRNGNGFVEWCEKRAGITLQTAHNYINTYEQRESIKLFDAFGKTALFMLAAPSTPQEVRDKASAIAADGGDVSVKAIKQLKAEHAKELAEEKRRNEDWRQQSNGQRKKIRDLEQQIDLLQARPLAQLEPEVQREVWRVVIAVHRQKFKIIPIIMNKIDAF